MMKSLRIALIAGLVFAGQQALSQQTMKGQPGRVVILDASGSMRSNSYPRGEGTRMEEAKALLYDYLDRLRRENDPIPTRVQVFGGKYSWDTESKKRGISSPSQYPLTGPMCSDIEFSTDFSTITKSERNRAWKQIKHIDWAGMTPLANAIGDALDTLDPEKGGEIVLISDMENPNCLPKGMTTCDVLKPKLAPFKRQSAPVNVLVVEVPNSTALETLKDCGIPISRIKHDPNDKEGRSGTIDKAFESVTVVTQVELRGQNVIDRYGVKPDGLRIDVIDQASNKAVGSVTVNGGIKVGKKAHKFLLTGPGGSWSVAKNIQKPSTVIIPADPSTVVLAALRNGKSIARLDEVVIRRPGGPEITRLRNVSLPATLKLANGRYEIEGHQSGASAVSTASLNLGKRSSVSLDLGNANTVAQTRDVAFDVQVAAATLDVASGFRPRIELQGPTGMRSTLAAGRTNIPLAPGRYEVVIGGANRHALKFEVAPAANTLDVLVQVKPGWFVAQSSAPAQWFELQDSTGKPLYSFSSTDRVEHSLPDGAYKMKYVGADDTEQVQAFSITTGDKTEIRFR